MVECKPSKLDTWVRFPSPAFAQIAQSVEQGTENPCVGGSIPPLGTEKNLREWLSGGASPCQGEGRGFDPRFALTRGCWNWQTGKTKDLVVNSREGSSPFSRILY